MSVQRIFAMAKETFRETRGVVLPALVTAGGALLVLIGRGLPPPMEKEGALSGAAFFGGLSLVLAFIAVSFGAWTLAADRRGGFLDFIRSKPLSGVAYYLGRFLGLAARITWLVLLAFLFGGVLIALITPDVKFSNARVAETLVAGGEEHPPDLPLLLRPEGAGVLWRFSDPAEVDGSRAGLRFKFRPRYPWAETFTDVLPLRVHVHQGNAVRIEREVEIRNRKSLKIDLPPLGSGEVRVRLQVPSGQNYLEIEGGGCQLVTGSAGPIRALLAAATALLPVLYLSLALALFFSAFVSVPTALFSTLVLSLVVLLGPSIQGEIRLAFAKDSQSRHQEDPEKIPAWKHLAARVISKGLSLLPDPKAGGGLDSLARMESPRLANVIRPWREGLPHLVIVIILGCLLAGRRAP